MHRPAKSGVRSPHRASCKTAASSAVAQLLPAWPLYMELGRTVLCTANSGSSFFQSKGL